MSSGQLVGLLRCDGQPRIVSESEKKKWASDLAHGWRR